MKKVTLVALLIFFSIGSSFSQDFEGTIRYEASFENLPAEVQAMMPKENPESLVYIKGGKTKTEMNMMGSIVIVISDVETSTTTTYTEVMGQKMKSTITVEDAEKVEIKIVEGETKEIAGFQCKKAIIKQDGNPEMEVYFSPDLKSDALSSMNPQFRELNGVPLEYQVHQQGMTMTYSAKEVKKQVIGNDTFNPPAGNYKEMPMPKY